MQTYRFRLRAGQWWLTPIRAWVGLVALIGLSLTGRAQFAASVGGTSLGTSGQFTLIVVSEALIRVQFNATLYGVAGSAANGEGFGFRQNDISLGNVGAFDVYKSGSTIFTTRSPAGPYSPSGFFTSGNFIAAGTADFTGTSGQTYLLSAIAYVSSVSQTTSVYYTFGQPPPRGKDASVGPIVTHSPQLLVAEPVDFVTGAFYASSVDLRLNGPLPIEIGRSYSSQNPAYNEFGYGWLPNFVSFLIPAGNLATIQAVDTNGAVLLFRRQGSTNVWAPTTSDNPTLINESGGAANLYNSTLTQEVDGDQVNYTWHLPNGSVRHYVTRQFPFAGGTRERPYLDTWSDNRGNLLSFVYGTDSAANDWGYVKQIKSSNGGFVTLTYNASGLIVKAVAGDGREVDYNYSFRGDLASVVLPDGQVTSYEYDVDSSGAGNHRLVKETKPNGRILTNSYDNLARVLQQQATVGTDLTPVTNATFDYSVVGQTTVRDAFSNPTVYQFTGGMVTQITDPLSQTISKTWYTTTDTPNGAYQRSVHTVTDQRGLVTTYRYDAQGNIIETNLTGDLVGDGVTTHTATTTAAYNSLNQPTSVTDPSGITTMFTYGDSSYPYLPTQIVTSKDSTTLRTDKLEYSAEADAANPTTLFSKGLLARKTVAFGSSDQAVTEYFYNTVGFITQQMAYTGTSDPDVTSTFAYNSRGELTSVTDADGRSTNFTYDGLSRPLTKNVKDETGSILGTWTTTYTGNGEVASMVGPRTGPANLITHTYDGAGRPLTDVVARSQALADGSGVQAAPAATTSYVHDFFGNLTSMTDPTGNITTYTYDGVGQMLTKSTAGLRAESFQYEPGGKVSQYTNPLGGITRTFYTATGQPRRQENPDGSLQEWRYYDDGRVQKEILRNASFWETVYDDINHKVTRTLKQSGGSTLATDLSEFDLRGNLIRHTDAEGFIKTATYDDLNRVKTAAGPASGAGSAQQTTTNSYGASTKVVSVQNGLNELAVTTSDALGRPVQTLVKSTGGATIRTTSYVYSADHNSVTVTQGSGSGAISQTTYTDTTGNAVLSVQGDGKFTLSTFDLNGNLLTSADALNQTTSYAYNGLNQAVSQTLPDGTVTSFTYNAAGGELTRGMASGTLTHEQTYDNAGRKVTERLFSGATSTRQFSYAYYDAASPFAGLLKTVTGPRTTVTTAYDDFLRPLTQITSGALDETNSTTAYTYDRRNLVTEVDQNSAGNAAGPATQVNRTYDGYGQLLTEAVTVTGVTHSSVTQTWDAAGRRASLHEAGATVGSPLFAYQYQADGAMTQVTANSQNFNFAYASNGLLATRTNPFRTLAVDSRDAVGRALQQTTTVSGMSAMVETLTWRANSTLASYAVNRSGAGAWSESRAYSYNNRGQLLSEGVSLAPGQSDVLSFAFDGPTTRLGIRTDAKLGAGAPTSWESTATTINAMGRVTFDQNTANPKVVPASGVSLGADHVDLLVDGVSQGRATHPGWADPVGTWSASLNLQPGSHTLTANAVHPSGQYTATASSTFTVPGDGSGGAITCAYDDDGNVTSRTWATGRVQTLTWDAFGRLIKVVERNATQTGYDWSAVYDGLGRRLKVTEQTVAGGTNVGSPTATTSIYDPQVEFLEIGVAIDGTKAWKVYGPDLNGWYGSLQGTGGLEATIVDTDRTTKGVISDQFGNGVGSVTGGVASWFATRVSAYGPLPGMFVETLTDITRVAEATVWRGHRVDATNFVFLGARYYEPTSGRFLSTDPKGHGSSMSLYDFANGDPVNYFDPTGRLGKLVNRVGSDGIIFANDHVYRLNPNRVNDPENLLVATLREMGQQLAATAQYDARILNAYFIQPPLYVLSELNHGAEMLGESVGIDPTAVNLFMMDASMGATALPKLGNLLELGATETTAAAESKVLVIGENMSQRVVPYAEKIGAEIYPGMPGYKAGMQAEALLDNGLYIEKAKDLGYRIIDIGPDFARRAATGTASEGYQLERFLTKDYTGYEKAFTR